MSIVEDRTLSHRHVHATSRIYFKCSFLRATENYTVCLQPVGCEVGRPSPLSGNLTPGMQANAKELHGMQSWFLSLRGEPGKEEGLLVCVYIFIPSYIDQLLPCAYT